MVAFELHPERFERPTFGSVDRRSIQLSYGCGCLGNHLRVAPRSGRSEYQAKLGRASSTLPIEEKKQKGRGVVCGMYENSAAHSTGSQQGKSEAEGQPHVG